MSTARQHDGRAVASGVGSAVVPYSFRMKTAALFGHWGSMEPREAVVATCLGASSSSIGLLFVESNKNEYLQYDTIYYSGFTLRKILAQFEGECGSEH